MTKLVKKETTDMVMYDYGDDLGQGYENQDSSDIKIPFLKLLQALNPEVKSVERGGVDGAEEGMLFHSVTKEAFDSLYFVPAATQHVYAEWVDRNAGGGFRGVHIPESEVVQNATSKWKPGQELRTTEGNQLIETFYMFGVVADEKMDSLGMVVISFSSTKISIYRDINTAIKSFLVPTKDGRKENPPIYANLLKIGSKLQTKNGDEYYNFDITPANGRVKDSLIAPNHPLFIEAKSCYEFVMSGQAKADEPANGPTEDDIPF